MRWWTAVAVAAAGLALGGSSPARANGRYPMANQLVVDPGNAAHLVARTTFGLLESADAGASWTWVCESALAALENAEDPAIAVTAQGDILIASSQGLTVSSDGCSWSLPAGGAAVTRFAVDVTINPRQPSEALAIEVVPGAGVYDSYLVATHDDGASWADVGVPLADFLATTVEIAASDPLRVYVAGKTLTTQVNALARSDDGGLTFTRLPIDGAPAAASAYVSAVDPLDAGILYLRVSPTTSAGGRVLVSRDGGATFSVLSTLAGDASGFALSPDGVTVAVGGPMDGLYVGASDGALRAAAGIKVSCLTWSGATLLSCADEPLDGFEIGASSDLGITFSPLLHLASLAPRACAGSRASTVCLAGWPAIAGAIGADAAVPTDSGGTGGAGGIDGAGGCGCELAEPARQAPLAVVVASGCVVWVAARGRRRLVRGARARAPARARCRGNPSR